MIGAEGGGVAAPVTVMVTNGGPHPPGMWAEVTANDLVQISPTAPDDRRAEAEAFKARLVEVLTGFHQTVQDKERAALLADGDSRLGEPIEGDEFLDHAMLDRIVAIAKGTIFEEHLSITPTIQYVRQVLEHHFHRSMHIERSWWADRNPDGENARAFRAAQQQSMPV